MEYRRGVLAYCTGVGYGMPGLRAHAMRYMKTFDDAVDIQQILVLAKEAFSTFESHLLNSEYPDYIRGKLEGAMEANGDFFKQYEFLQGFGNQSMFDRFMVESVVSVYSKKISSLSNENKTLKAVNESLCKDKDEPTCPQKSGPTWPQTLSVSDIHESTVVSPGSAGLFEDDRSGGSSSDAESVDTDLGFVSIGKNNEVQEKQPSHVEASA